MAEPPNIRAFISNYEAIPYSIRAQQDSTKIQIKYLNNPKPEL